MPRTHEPGRRLEDQVVLDLPGGQRRRVKRLKTLGEIWYPASLFDEFEVTEVPELEPVPESEEDQDAEDDV